MIIPATLNDKVNPFNGVLVFQITPTAIKFKTLIDHIISTANDNIYERQVQRILYVEDLLFTKSLCLLKVNNLYTFVNEKIEHLPCD
jgi:sucrose-6-phosphate hydrolase SacC (GH32 family)